MDIGKAAKLLKSSQISILNLETGFCNERISQLYKEIKSIRDECQHNMKRDDYNAMWHRINIESDDVLRTNNDNLHKKFQALKGQQYSLADLKYESSFIKNLSDVFIPKEVLILLGLGPKFALIPQSLPTPDIITDIEYIIKRYAEEPIKDAIRSQLLYTVTKHTKAHRKPNRIDKFLIRAVKVFKRK